MRKVEEKKFDLVAVIVLVVIPDLPEISRNI